VTAVGNFTTSAGLTEVPKFQSRADNSDWGSRRPCGKQW